MSFIRNIIEDKGILEYLQKRKLLDQYKSTKTSVLNKINNKTFFKERLPKGSNIWYFRINKQYRAFGSFDSDGDLRIFKIDNHS